MSSTNLGASDRLIAPLTFLQVMQSSSAVMNAMLEQDSVFRHWFGQSELWRAVARWTTLPVYYHWLTSGYTAIVDNRMAGWMFVRGRQQILYIETLATHSDWRRRGVGRMLLRFAESLAQELDRRWMGLTVTLSNIPAINLYEKEGYQRGHSRVMVATGDPSLALDPTIQARPLLGLAAEQAYQRFALIDITASGSWDMDASLRMIPYDTHRQWGQGWIIEADSKPVGYASRGVANSARCVYLACDPEWWGNPQVLSAALRVARDSRAKEGLALRLGSDAHHRATQVSLFKLGFEEREDKTALMFKAVNHGPSAPTTSSGG